MWTLLLHRRSEITFKQKNQANTRSPLALRPVTDAGKHLLQAVARSQPGHGRDPSERGEVKPVNGGF